jgi:predicted DNA-binding transcriptional regulator YafY
MKKPSSDASAYQVVDRLLALRGLLRARPHTWTQIVSRLPDDYKDDDSGKRKLRRDLQYLARWGYDVERDSATKTYALTITEIEHDWTEKEVLALATLRESFASGTPCAETIQGLLGKIEQGLNEDNRSLYKRKPALTIRFTAAEDTAPTTGVRQKLESAIQRHQRIRFRYKPSDRPRIIDHPDDEPIELFFDEGHYYMWTYCYKMSRMYKFRVSMIVPDSIEILPKRAEGRWRPQMVHFKYWLSPKIAERSVSPRFPDMDIDLEKSDKGGVIVTASASSEFQAIQEILRYGEQAEILSPDSLRAKMRRVVEQMALLYSRTVE